MNALELQHLIGTQLISLSEITVTEDDVQYTLDDSFLLTTTTKQYQLLRLPDDLYIYEIDTPRDLRCWDFNHDEISIRIQAIHQIQNQNPVNTIYNYAHGSYLFGSQYRDAQDQFIVGFCYGFDEIILQTEDEFKLLLTHYPGCIIEEITTN